MTEKWYNDFTHLGIFTLYFLTAISHRGLRNDFFFLYQLIYFPYSIWTFISLYYLDFYLPFIIGILLPFSIWTSIFIRSFNLFSIFQSFFDISNRGLILDFFRFFFFFNLPPIFLNTWQVPLESQAPMELMVKMPQWHHLQNLVVTILLFIPKVVKPLNVPKTLIICGMVTPYWWVSSTPFDFAFCLTVLY